MSRHVGGIYAIVNVNSDNIAYIGSTSRFFRQRWNEHRRGLRLGKHPNAHLQSAWDKHGEDSFAFIVLEITADLLSREQALLDCWKETNAVYNMGDDVGRPRVREGWHHTEASKRRMSIAHTGKVLSKQHRRALGLSRLGHGTSDETRRKIGSANKGNSSGARSYPAFVHRETGETIPPGRNLTQLCRERNLHPGSMIAVKNGNKPSYRGWIQR